MYPTALCSLWCSTRASRRPEGGSGPDRDPHNVAACLSRQGTRGSGMPIGAAEEQLLRFILSPSAPREDCAAGPLS
jgi:hypothetical protein